MALRFAVATVEAIVIVGVVVALGTDGSDALVACLLSGSFIAAVAVLGGLHENRWILRRTRLEPIPEGAEIAGRWEFVTSRWPLGVAAVTLLVLLYFAAGGVAVAGIAGIGPGVVLGCIPPLAWLRRFERRRVIELFCPVRRWFPGRRPDTLYVRPSAENQRGPAQAGPPR